MRKFTGKFYEIKIWTVCYLNSYNMSTDFQTDNIDTQSSVTEQNNFHLFKI